MRRWGILGLILVLVACSTTATPTSEGAANVAASRCTPASPVLLQRLRDGLKPGATLTSVSVVKSNDFQQVWFAAGRITGTGIPIKTVGLWAVNDLSGGGLTYSINATALSFSTWGNGTKTDAKIRANDDGAQDAIKCAS